MFHPLNIIISTILSIYCIFLQFKVSQKCIEIYDVVIIDRLKRHRFLSVAILCHKVAKSVYSKETRNLIGKKEKTELVFAFALYLCFKKENLLRCRIISFLKIAMTYIFLLPK